MVLVDFDSSTTSCPECGKEMPLTTWAGEKPRCYSCAMTEQMKSYGSELEFSEESCLHEGLENSKPENQKGGAHMLACSCPKCSARV